MSKESPKHLQRVRELGCLICLQPANAHHIREERIRNDYLTIPLCREHHQGDFSIYMSKRQFENIYGSELELLAQTIKLLLKHDRF